MPHHVTFDCPSCSAPVEAPDDAISLRCAYCGNNLMVPEELRPKPQQPPPQLYTPTIVIHTATTSSHQGYGQVINLTPEDSRKMRRGLGCAGSALLLTIIAAILVPVGFAAWSIYEAFQTSRTLFNAPGTKTEESSFARREASFGGRGRGPGLFEGAADLAVDGAGDIYVIEGTSGRVQRLNREGQYLNGWVIENEHPSAIAADTQTNEVYVVADPKIYRFEGPTGKLIGMTREDGSGFYATRDAAVLPDGNLLTYVSGGDSEGIVLLSPDGQEVTRYSDALSKVYGKGKSPPPWLVYVAADRDGKMLILNNGAGIGAEVLIYGPDGAYITRFGGKRDGPATSLTAARGIATDSKGRIYIGSTSGVQVFDYKGNSLGSISILGGIAGLEVTGNDELLVISNTQEISKFVPNE